jgi:hypothetical protein
MRNYFKLPMQIGKYSDQPIGTVFSNNRQYFDQVLYKNISFRHNYKIAFDDWVKRNNYTDQDNHKFLSARIEEGIYHTGIDKVKKIFHTVIQIINTEFSDQPFCDNIDFRETLPGGKFDKADFKPMERIRRFWVRIAIPEVWED